MNIGSRIKTRRKDIGISADILANTLKISRATMYRYESGGIEKLPIDILVPLAKALHTSPAYLMGWVDEPDDIKINNAIYPIQLKKYPLLGTVSCGQPVLANEEIELYVDVGTSINADFCLKAKGDSMINARIFDGDIVFIRQQPDVENGEIAVILIEDEATLKRVYKYPGRVELRPENPIHKVLNYENNEIEQLKILGKAVAFQSDVR